MKKKLLVRTCIFGGIIVIAGAVMLFGGAKTKSSDIVRLFFSRIGERRAASAISLMSPSLVGDKNQKQAWLAHFKALQSVKVKDIKPENPAGWSNDKHVYKVTLDVQVKPEAANAPIPNYGWENGVNIRWIALMKSDGLWKISEIATGP